MYKKYVLRKYAFFGHKFPESALFIFLIVYGLKLIDFLMKVAIKIVFDWF
jgi:hypothetical protein